MDLPQVVQIAPAPRQGSHRPDVGRHPTTHTSTATTPSSIMSMRRAAPFDRSTTRPSTNGPRSFTTTRTDCPVSIRFTRITVPKGRVRWAAVRLRGAKRSPEAVALPRNPGPYHDASPVSSGCRAAQPDDSAVRHSAHTRTRLPHALHRWQGTLTGRSGGPSRRRESAGASCTSPFGPPSDAFPVSTCCATAPFEPIHSRIFAIGSSRCPFVFPAA